MVHVSPLELLAFLGEVALLVLLAVAGARLGDGPVGVLLAVAFPLLMSTVWARWLAPRAARPLALRPRLAAKAVVVVVCAGLAALSGLLLPGLAALVVVGPLFAVAELRGEAGHGDAAT